MEPLKKYTLGQYIKFNYFSLIEWLLFVLLLVLTQKLGALPHLCIEVIYTLFHNEK